MSGAAKTVAAATRELLDGQWQAKLIVEQGHAAGDGATGYVDGYEHLSLIVTMAIAMLRNLGIATDAHQCTKPGALGPCMPRVSDGRCIWCERLMPPYEPDQARRAK